MRPSGVPSVDLSPRALRDAHPGTLLGAAGADARRLLVLRVQQRDVRDVHRALALDHADLRVGARGVRARVALDDVDPLDVDPVVLAVHAEDLAGLALVL